MELSNMKDHAMPSSTGSFAPVESNTVGWRKAKIGISSFCLLIGIALVIVAVVIPPIIDKVVEKGVLDVVRLDPDVWSQEDYAKWVNATSYQDFYFFNITNLYDALTKGVPINYAEIPVLRTYKHNIRYNISWNVANSEVSYQWLTEFEVFEEDKYLLDLPIIGPNLLYLGAATSIMQQSVAVANGQDPTSPTYQPTAEFPGGFLSDQLTVLGLFGGKILPGVIPIFTDPINSPFLKTIRGSGAAFYTGFLKSFCASQSINTTTVLANWARGTPYISGIAPSYWVGFELSKTLTSADPDAVAAAAFDATNNYGFASNAGLTNWQKFGAMTDPTSPAYQQLAGAIMVNLKVNVPTDLAILGGWLGTLTSSLPGTALGDAYQKVVCAAIGGTIAAAVTAGGGVSPFSRLFANVPSYVPSTWADVGALQFGTGLIVGLSIPGTPTLTDGKGFSISDLPATPGSPPLPFGFDNNLKQAQPMEFTAGVKYYLTNNNLPPTATATWPAGASQALLWQTNPSLVYLTGSTIINLNVLQSKQLLGTLKASSSALGGLITQLAPIVGTYAAVFQQQYAGTGNLTTAISAATTAAGQAFSVETAKPTSILLGAGVTTTNYYVVWCYLYNYLSNEMTGTLAELDPTTGIGPQNNGLFAKHTVRELMFGYTNKLGTVIPGIAGPIFNGNDPQKNIDADYLTHNGREWHQDTGHRDVKTVAQWLKYEGTDKYQNACDLNDPKRTGVCSPAGSLAEASNNWRVWGDVANITGSGNSLQIQPFTEGDAKRPNMVDFYVSEIRRPVQVIYQSDTTYKSIGLRRYGLFQALINSSYGPTPNINKNQDVWRQGLIPDGFFGTQTIRGGSPLMAGVPHFGQCDPKVFLGATCDGGDCSKWYRPADHDTYLDIHPLTGLTMVGSKKLQATLKISAQEYFTGTAPGTPGGYPGYPAALPPGYPTDKAPGGLNYHYNNLFKNTDTLYVPFYWADVHDAIKDADAQKVLDSEAKIKKARKAQSGILYGGFIAGAVAIIGSLLGLIFYCRASSNKY